MPSLKARLAGVVEQSPLQPVAEQDRRGWFFLVAIKVGVMICVPLFALGGDLGSHTSLRELLPAVLAGCWLTALLVLASAEVGRQARVPTAVLVARTFGGSGGRLVALLLLLTLFGWFGVQTEVLVHSIRTLLAGHGEVPPRLPLTLLCGLLISTTAIVGFRALGKVAYLAVPLLLAVIAVPTVSALAHAGPALWNAAPDAERYGAGTVISVIAGGHMVAAAVAPDITRFVRSRRDNVVGILLAYGLILPLLLMIAAFLASVHRSGDLIAVLAASGFGAPALAVVVLATWTANDKNLYESSLSMSVLLPRAARWKLALAAGLIGTGLAAANIFEHFIAMLIWMGITIAPMAGVYLADFSLDPARYRDHDTPTPRWRAVPLVAWALGFAVGLSTAPRSAGGLQWWTISSAPTLDALLAGALAGWALGAWPLAARVRKAGA